MTKPASTPKPSEPTLTSYDGHWIDPETFKSYGISFKGVKTDAPPPDTAGIQLTGIDEEDVTTPLTFGDIAANFQKLKAVAGDKGKNDVAIRLVRGIGDFLILEDTQLSNVPAVTKDTMDLISTFDTIRTVNPGSDDDQVFVIDTARPIYTPEYYANKIVSVANDYPGENRMEIVAKLNKCRELADSLRGLSGIIDDKFKSADPNQQVTIGDILLFKDLLGQYYAAEAAITQSSSAPHIQFNGTEEEPEKPKPRVIE